ncbi:MAG: glutathione S-transferase family protein [Bauldia sp.]|nr:glutathione S-transferase family protein [Bauldia sp.]
MAGAGYTLLSNANSPFSRKARIAIGLLGLGTGVTVEAVDTVNPSPDFLARVPLGKIPALLTPEGGAIFDSRVILAFLDGLAGGGRIVPPDPADAIRAETLQALADGIMDAAVLGVYEGRFRQENERSTSWVARQMDKVRRALDALEADLPADRTSVGEISLACALGYLDLRFGGLWRADHPGLVAWLDRFAAAVPAFAETAPG